ncbi:cytochrome c biogenesis CcdA family protein [Paraurantiacibacter namhicola]|uniref:Cytochrome C biogenesis protein transmembrane region n=1 Tax=Paraurantiacibacter namhicola TaxID=645517 RepID=A0A1C7D5A5_9SPHN|nr:cytochrome c biogenesis protein CcdA [Paraurantiacibacter namhicola]ANU06483.1 Cytochrome C biogenesis protein transmembrane region [Paraurantiacibacter namhicola]
MTASYLLALLAGAITILNPCVLPLMPVIVGSSLGKSRYGPLALALGLVLSFTVFGFAVLAFGHAIGLDARSLRVVAGVLLALAGVVLLVPPLQAKLSQWGAPLANVGNRMLGRVGGDGAGGQFLVGTLLGIVWAPCVGPTLGAAIGAASAGENLAQSFATFAFFGVGVAGSILAFAYGSRAAMRDRVKGTAAIAKYAKPVFGVILFGVGLAVLTGADKLLEAAILDLLPQSLVDFTTRY